MELLQAINKERSKDLNDFEILKQLCKDSRHINYCFYNGKEYMNRRIIAHYPYSNRILFARYNLTPEEMKNKNEVKAIIEKLKNDKKFFGNINKQEFGHLGLSILHPKVGGSYFTVMIQDNNGEKFEEAYQACIAAIDDSKEPNPENIMEIINKFRYVIKLHELSFVDEVMDTVKQLSSTYKDDPEVISQIVDYANEHDGNFVFLSEEKEMNLREVVFKLFEMFEFLNLILSSAHGFGINCIKGVGYFLITTYSQVSDIGITDDDVVDNVVEINPWENVKNKAMTPRAVKTPKAAKTPNSNIPKEKPEPKNQEMMTPVKKLPLDPKKIEKSERIKDVQKKVTPAPKVEVQTLKVDPPTPRARTPTPRAEPSISRKAYVWKAEDEPNSEQKGIKGYVWKDEDKTDFEQEVLQACIKRKEGRSLRKFDNKDIENLRIETERIANSNFIVDEKAINDIITPAYDSIYVTSFKINKNNGPETIIREALAGSKKKLPFNPYLRNAEVTTISVTMAKTKDYLFFLYVFGIYNKEKSDSIKLIEALNNYRVKNGCSKFEHYQDLTSFASQGVDLMIQSNEVLPMCDSQREILMEDGALDCDSTVLHIELPRGKYIEELAQAIIDTDKEKLLSNFDTIGASFKNVRGEKGTYFVGIYYERRH